jgi:metal transporter CNNM
LIGEEIYDEFDPQGAHAELSSYTTAISSQQDPQGHAPSTKAKDESTASNDEFARPRGTTSLASSPVLKPISLKGLNFLRSRSAPPTPRDPVPSMVPSTKRTSDAQGTASTLPRGISFPSLSASTAVEEEKIVKVPQVVVAPSPLFTPTLDQGDCSSAVAAERKSKSTPVSLVSHPVISRSSSPPLALEAILLDRKRRLHAATPPPSGSPAVALPGGDSRKGTSPSIKGRFKSSPIGGGDSIGVVVAEKVKEVLSAQGLLGAGSQGDERVQNVTSLQDEAEVVKEGHDNGWIADRMDKEGSDKQDHNE